MLIKFETRSNRVKGLSFHSKRPWILASLSNGVIELWDYQIGVLIDAFCEHKGPVRAVHFHPIQSLFVSGGDDTKIKMWNYKSRKCLFTLLGHKDYIRTVQFHNTLPWICSASDDSTIRIWNFQNQETISVLSAHSDYVMSASFHPVEDLLVSGSMDGSVRVWDLGVLVEKTVSPLEVEGEVESKFVIEAHERGVVSVDFRKRLPMIVSAGDDRVIKIWSMSGTRVWETDKIKGHTGKISCVLFHAKKDIIISNSQDKTIKFFDITNGSLIKTFQRERDRFWTLSLHPNSNLIAAGHDSGLMVFKLERERPVYFLSLETNKLFSVKDWILRIYDLDNIQGKNTRVLNLKRPVDIYGKRVPISLSYNKILNSILVSYEDEGESSELYNLSLEVSGTVTGFTGMSFTGTSFAESNKSYNGMAVYISRDRFAVLNKELNLICIKNIQNETVNKCELPMVPDYIHHAGPGNILCINNEEISIFDLSQRKLSEIGKLTAQSVKYISWSNDMKQVALISKKRIILASDKLSPFCTVSDAHRIKSGAWDDNEKMVFIYNTTTHMKYCLKNGDIGVIKTLEKPVYIIKVVGSCIYCLDRDDKLSVVKIDNSEYKFKLSLMRQKNKQVMCMVKYNSKLCGEAINSYLEEKGFNELALNFTKDDKIRFNLAINSGKFDIAINAANKINEKNYWYILGTEALKQGNISIAEYSYQQSNNFEKLSFLYLITGNIEKLSKITKLPVKNNVMGRFQNLLYLGDIKGRVKILEKSENLALAYLTSLTHGLNETTARLASEMREKVPEPENFLKVPELLIPPKPLICAENWPLVDVFKGGENEKLGFQDEDEEGDNNSVKIDETEASSDAVTGEHLNNSFSVPPAGKSTSQTWTEKSYIVSDYAAAGNLKTAVQLLKRQIGISNFAPLKQLFLDLYIGSYTYLKANASVPALSVPIQNPNSQNAPSLILKLSQFDEILENAYNEFKNGKLNESLKLFLSILHKIPLLKVNTLKEVDEVRDLIGIAREYSLGVKMEILRKGLNDNLIRQQELAAYITNCKLRRDHFAIVLSNAMKVCYKNKNYETAAYFARAFLKNYPNGSEAKNARIVIDFQAIGSKIDKTELKFDYENPNFEICGESYEPIYKGLSDLVCSYCGAHFLEDFKGKVCAVCEIGTVGRTKVGLVCSPAQFGK